MCIRDRAFGEWSLPSKKTQVERFLEEQLDKAFDFYKNEVEVRSWYGMFNYGDIMHTYDPFRHSWRYDMGGYAWPVSYTHLDVYKRQLPRRNTS